MRRRDRAATGGPPSSGRPRPRAEEVAWRDGDGKDAPAEQWAAVLAAIRRFRPVYRDGYCHNGVTLHEVLE